MRASDPVRPPHLRQRSWLGLGAFAAACALVLPAVYSTPLESSLINRWAIFSIVALGYYLVFALGGRFSFAHALMVALGAYTAGWASETHSFVVGVLLAIAVVSAAALALGLLLRNAHHFYFAIGSFAATQLGMAVIEKSALFGGLNGSRFGVPMPEILGWEPDGADQLFFLLLAALVLCLALVTAVERSPMRREMIAVRDGDTVAAASGVAAPAQRLRFFVLGSVMAGFAGALSAYNEGFVTPDQFQLDLSISVLLMVILGGTGSKWGPIAGALFVVMAPEYLAPIERYQSLVYGALLVVVIVVAPDGLVGALRHLRRRVTRAIPRSEPPSAAHEVEVDAASR